MSKPPMSERGKVMFITMAYPPNPTAASNVHQHLLNCFDPDSFMVVSGRFHFAKKVPVSQQVNVKYIYHSLEFYSTRLHRMLASLQRRYLPFLLRRMIRKYKPAVVVGAYPDLYFLDLAYHAATSEKVPFVPYLHDTVVEGTYNPASKPKAQALQDAIFKNSWRIAVMSEGMRKLYQDKYKLESTAWEHIYPETAGTIQDDKVMRLHWSGDIYEINKESVKRVNEALKLLKMPFTISNGKPVELLNSFGITGDHISKVFYPERKDYLKHLAESKILLLGLNYPDETSVDVDELSTIFSTKTPEYLASGSLIVFQGPKEYFLARFLTEHQCGVVIDSRNVQDIYNELKGILENYDNYRYMVENAFKTLRIFSPEYITNKVCQTLS